MKILKRTLKYLFIAAGVMMLALISIIIIARSGKPTPLPNPNGFDDFVTGGSLISDRVGNASEMSHSQLKAFLTTNEPALKSALVGLQRECRISDDYSTNTMNEYFPASAAIRKVALSLRSEARLAEMENRTNEVVDKSLTLISFAVKSCRGGFVVWKWPALDYEQMGRVFLEKLTNSLSAADCRNITHTLESIDAEEEPISEILARDTQLELKGTTLKVKLRSWREYLNEPGIRNHFRLRFQTNTLNRRQLMLAFAARAYELDKGKPPTSAAALVPDYLKKVPRDPTTGKDLALK